MLCLACRAPALKKAARAIWAAVVEELQGWEGAGNRLPGSLGEGSAILLGNLAEATSVVFAVGHSAARMATIDSCG